MMKTTQFITNTKVWQNIFVAIMFLFSFSINSQNVGDDLMASTNGVLDSSNNSGQGTGCLPGGAAYDGTTACGWTAAQGVNYAPTTNANGSTHSGDRMWKTFAGNGGNGEFVAQEFSQLQPGTYTLTFYHKWTNGGAVDYSAGDGPQLTLKISDGNGGWTNLYADEVPLGNIGAGAEWTEMTVTYEITEVNDYKLQIYKDGGGAAAPTNMYGSLHLDTFSFVYTAAASTGPTPVVAPWSDNFDDGAIDDWTLYQAADASQGWVVANNGASLVLYHADDNVATGVDNYAVSPLLDCSGLTAPLLSYSETGAYQSYYTRHSVLYSSDYDGTNAATATWVELTEGAAPTTATVMEFSVPTTTTGIAFRYEGDYSDTWEIDDVSVSETPVDPSMSVTASVDGADATFTFDIDNFVVGDGSDASHDGHIHYSLNGGAEVMVYSSADLTLSGLPNGDHTIVFSLVDSNHQPLDPAVSATVAFSTFDGTAACGDTVSICYDSDSNPDPVLWFTSTAAAGETISVTFAGGVESGYDFVTVTNGAGTQIGDPLTGDLNGVTVTSDDGTVMVYINPDTSWSCVSGQSGFASLDATVNCEAPAQANVTFSVDMSNYPGGLGENDGVFLNGNFEVNGGQWCGDCNPMSDDDGDNIWTITLPFDPGNYEYKFTVNGWNNQEQFSEVVDGCTVSDGTYTNRSLVVPDTNDMTLDTVFWNLCPGETPGNFYTVTFEVNTSAIVGGVGPNGIYAGGGVLGNAQALQLLDDDGDGVYVGSISLEEGTTGNYIFLNSPSDGGDWGAKENLEGQDCADPANYNDRILEPVTGDTTLLACFGYCSGNGTGECPSDIVTYNVTFSVNMCDTEVGENGVFAGGGVLGGANAVALSDDDGDGVWEATVPMEAGTSGNYAFFNSPSASDDWNTKEVLTGQACADPNNYDDRILAEVTSDVTLIHTFGYCAGDGTGACPAASSALMLQGIIDFTVPSGGSDGKAIHLVVDSDIADLSEYGIGVANNGGGTDGQEYTFPVASPVAGAHILVVRSVEAMDAYMDASNIFDHVFVDDGGSISQNGDDAIELYHVGQVIEVFGDVDVDGTGQDWEYMDSWAYKVEGAWTYGGVDCTDGSTTTCDSGCPYPFADCGPLYDLTAAGGWRYQYEVGGYRGVGPGDSFNADWWNAAAYEDFDNAAFPNDSGVNNGMVDDIMYFNADGTFTFDTGDDMSIMGKKPEIDAAFDPDGTSAYPADNGFNEYFNYPLDDFSDTYVVGDDGTYTTITFATVGALGFYTSVGAQEYQILSSTASTIYVRNVGSEGNAWYSMLTTDAHALSTSDNEILDMIIYPNPVDNGYITILSPVQGLKEIQVFTVDGRKVMDTTINGNTLDVSSFNSGFYMLKVTIDGQSKVSKLVVR